MNTLKYIIITRLNTYETFFAPFFKLKSPAEKRSEIPRREFCATGNGIKIIL